MQYRAALFVMLSVLATNGRANGPSTPADPPVDLQSYTAVYELEKSGITIAEATFTLKPDESAGGWLFTSHAEPRGFASLLTSQTISEQARFQISADGDIRPSRYTIEHSDEERAAEDDLDVRYDWRVGTASVNYRDKTTQIDLETPLLDPLSEQAALMLDLHDAPATLTYRVVDDGRAERHRYTVEGEETVETAGGSYRATRVVREHGKRRTVMWFGHEVNFLPVKILRYRKDELKSELTLNRITFH